MGTLVERHSRYVMLLELPNGRTTENMHVALTAQIVRLPEHLRHSLTWSQCKEMAAHTRFTVDTTVQINFSTRTVPGNAAAMKTQMVFCDSISRGELTSAPFLASNSMPSPMNSTDAHGKRSTGGHSLRYLLEPL